MEDLPGLLREALFFRSLPQEVLTAVARVCREERFAPGDLIFAEGARADKFYIILEGTVEVWKDWAKAERDMLAVHSKGHLFGEMALIDELPRSATVVARDAVLLLSIGRDDFHRIITENSAVALSIMRSVSSMVRVSNETFVDNLRRRNSELLKANRELKDAQDKLLRAERLSMLGKFSSLILHDIRNPIGILRGFAEMVLLRPEDTEVVRRNVGRIIAEADRLNRIAGDLLDFSRGEIRLNMSIVDPRELIGRVVETVSERFASRGIEVRTEIGSPGSVILDFDRFLRVLLNLADNSRKAMPKGGTFTIAVAREQKWIVFEVRDTGEGIEKEVQDRLFEPFFTGSKEGGTGLGMAIVKGIVDAHEGKLSISSKRNEGTVVRISLPILG